MDLGEKRSRSHTDNRMLWNLPVELFHDFEAHAFRPFSVIGSHIHVYKGPSIFTGDLCAQTVNFVIVSSDTDDVGAVDQRINDFPFFEVRGNKDEYF